MFVFKISEVTRDAGCSSYFLTFHSQLLIYIIFFKKSSIQYSTVFYSTPKPQATNNLGSFFLCQCPGTTDKVFLNFNSTSIWWASCPLCKSTVKLCPSFIPSTASPHLHQSFKSVSLCLAQRKPQLSRTKGGHSCDRQAGIYIVYILGRSCCIFLKCQL